VRIGYARTSTRDQDAGFQVQLDELEGLGVEKIYREQVSAVGKRTELEAAIEYIRAGDVLVVTKLDRLARSMSHLSKIMETLKAKGSHLNIINLGMDSSTPTGQLILNVLGSVAQFEREMMLERQRDGIAAAKAEGKYVGRQPTARAKTEEVHKLKAQGMGPSEIATKLNIGRTSVYRILKAQ
jgi:DNA invertase Pin-like site-specific DNA recombinase